MNGTAKYHATWRRKLTEIMQKYGITKIESFVNSSNNFKSARVDTYFFKNNREIIADFNAPKLDFLKRFANSLVRQAAEENKLSLKWVVGVTIEFELAHQGSSEPKLEILLTVSRKVETVVFEEIIVTGL